MTKRIDPKKFIHVWQTSSTTAEAAQRLNMKKSAVASRATQYRRKGIPLKKYDRGVQSLDIPTLAAYARSLEEQDNATEAMEQKLQTGVQAGPLGQKSEEEASAEECDSQIIRTGREGSEG